MEHKTTQKLTYQAAGVDIEAGGQLVERIRSHVQSTQRPEVLGGFGGFGALFELSSKYQRPVLVSGADGVGTKLRCALQWGGLPGIGVDLVAMNVNDILAQGAEPLFFLDYYACSHLVLEDAEQVIRGIAEGCSMAGCALIGGETAEMPGIYRERDFDLAGFVVGVAEKAHLLQGVQTVQTGDVILGLASSGVHANGFSLVRKILEVSEIDAQQAFIATPEGAQSVSDCLMQPTRIYVRSLLPLVHSGHIRALAHITGGGLIENVPRVMPNGTQAVISSDAWKIPSIFSWLQQKGNVPWAEMYRVFNCGVGMAVVVSAPALPFVQQALREAQEQVYVLGYVEKANHEADAPRVVLTGSRMEDGSSIHIGSEALWNGN